MTRSAPRARRPARRWGLEGGWRHWPPWRTAPPAPAGAGTNRSWFNSRRRDRLPGRGPGRRRRSRQRRGGRSGPSVAKTGTVTPGATKTVVGSAGAAITGVAMGRAVPAQQAAQVLHWCCPRSPRLPWSSAAVDAACASVGWQGIGAASSCTGAAVAGSMGDAAQDHARAGHRLERKCQGETRDEKEAKPGPHAVHSSRIPGARGVRDRPAGLLSPHRRATRSRSTACSRALAVRPAARSKLGARLARGAAAWPAGRRAPLGSRW